MERGSSSLYVPSPLKIPDDLIFLHQFIVKSLKNRAADVELENNFTNGMGHDIQRLPIRFNEVIIVLCAELNLTSNYGFIKDEIFLFKMRFFSFYTQISNWKVSRSETYVLCTYFYVLKAKLNMIDTMECMSPLRKHTSTNKNINSSRSPRLDFFFCVTPCMARYVSYICRRPPII